jgi:hypothetical protein
VPGTSLAMARGRGHRLIAQLGPPYQRHRPESTALYEVVRDNLETLYGAISDGALAVRIPKHARRELEAYLGCGLLCWKGFVRLRCGECGESQTVAFSCKGRGFCPSCLGRRMNATAANLIERVLPDEASLRQWVLTFPFPWRAVLARDGAELAALSRIFEETVQGFYARRAREEGHPAGRTGSVTVVQRTCSDLRVNPHLHGVFLDGTWHEEEGDLVFRGLGHLRTSEVGEVLERTIGRIERHLERRGRWRRREDEEEGQMSLEASAVWGRTPPAGPQWVRGRRAPEQGALGYDKPLCVSLDGFTLHAATRAGALDPSGREALLRYVPRPPIAQDRIEPRPDGLVRIILKKPYADGTVAVDLAPLSLLSRLAASVPPPRHHTVRYAGVLGAASEWRPRIVPAPEAEPRDSERAEANKARSGYRRWAELLGRTFAVDALACPACGGRMRPIAVVRNPASIERYLEGVGEVTALPTRSPDRGPPYWRSTMLRRRATGGEDA